MKGARMGVARWLAILCLLWSALPAYSSSFSQFLSSFEEVSLPFAVDEQIPDSPVYGTEWESGTSLSTTDVEAFILVPARSLEASRWGLRCLEEWAEKIHDEKRVRSEHTTNALFRQLTFSALGQATVNGHLLLVVSCYQAVAENPENGPGGTNDALLQKYILSFTPAGRLVDGLPLFQPRKAEWGLETLPEDPIHHQGRQGLLSATIDSRKHLLSINRFTIGEVVTEVARKELGLSGDGTFQAMSAERRYLLSRVFRETGDTPGELFLYEPVDTPAPSGPLYLVYRGGPDREPIEGEAEAGLTSSGSIAARSDSGLTFNAELAQGGAGATLTDANGGEHTLELACGPGGNGEKTQLWDRLWLGDRYDPSSRAIGYLFAPARLTSTRGRADPIGGPAGAELLFDAHTLVLGNLHEGSEEVEPESISEGTLADGIPWIFNETPVRLMPHSAALFEEGAVFGTLGADAVVAWDEGKTPLAAGTRFFIAGLGMIPDWALPSKDTTVTVKKLTIPIPAGSTIRSQWERIAGIVFSKPVQIRVGAAALSLFSAGFANTGPNHLTDAALSAPATVSFGGKTVALTDRVTFDELGNLKSGRLQADTAFTMGGRTITLRGGYDPEEPDAGMVGVYPSGRVRSGVLAAAADFPLGKTRVRLVRGDAVRFREDGSVEACTPAAGVTVTAGGRQVRFAGGELVVNPDGTVASGALAADTTLEVGGTAATFLGGSGIFFYPSGAISGGKVRATTMKLGLFEGRVEGDARFFENGVPYWAVPLGAVSVGGFAYFFRYVQLDSSRRVIEGEVVKPTDVPVGGRHYVFSSIMRFYESGSVRAGGLSTSLMEPFSFTINGSPLETSLEYVCFYPDGAMMWARTPTNNASTFNNATIPDWSSVYVYRSKEGNERVFFFPRTEQYRDLVTQDVPFTLVGEEILIPAGSTVDNAFFTDTPDDAAALLTKDVTFRGRVLGHAGAFVSRTEMAKGIMEMKAGAASGTALFATSTQSRVRVRRAANLQGETVGSLEKGDRVQVLDKSADMMKVGDMTDYWYRVRRVSDGLSGWTYGYYLAAEQ